MAPRSPIGFELTPEVWPLFSDNQVSFLESKFPARCIKPSETIEDHLRYAGVVDLVQQLRMHVMGNPQALALTEDEEDALDEEAAVIVLQRQLGEPQQE